MTAVDPMLGPGDLPPAIDAEVREGRYGTKITEVEPGGAGFIPLEERRGRPVQLFWTWMSPNLEFATVFVGVIAVLFFNLTLPMALLAIVLGSALGSLSHGVLSARGPSFGVPQMVLSRISFGYRGNILPAGVNALTAGIGWFAVNSVSGALALNALSRGHVSKVLCLVVVVAAQILIAFFGYNMLEWFEKYAFPILAVIFLVTCFIIFTKAHPSSVKGGGGIGGFLITLGAAFGYAAGWNPYASDYTRYFKPDTSRSATGLWAFLGVFVSCVLLEAAGAAAVAIPGVTWDNPTSAFTSSVPSWLGDLTLLAIALGAVAANVINIYSGAISFLAIGFNLPLALRRAIVALGFGAIGFVVAIFGLNDVSKYENFLLVIAYWIGPWLGVYFTDQFLRRRHHVAGFLFDKKHNPYAGWISMLVAMVVSIWLFSNQTKYVGLVPKHWPSFGDIGFEVGFVLAALLYWLLFSLQRDRTDEDMRVVAARA